MPPTSRMCSTAAPRTSCGSWTATRPIPRARWTPRGPAACPTFGPRRTTAPPAQFNGYTQGPGYYGKTFFLWPPDPRTTVAISSAQSQDIPQRSRRQCDGRDHSRQQLEHLAGPGHDHRLDQPANLVEGKQRRSGGPLHHDQQVCPGLQQRRRSTTPSAGSSTGLIRREPAMARSPRIGGIASSARPAIPCCSTATDHLDLPGSSTYTINYNAILSWIAQTSEPLPDAAAGGPHQVLRIDPDGDHRKLAQLRQHRPAVLGRVHRPRARLQANVRRACTTDISAMAGYGSDFTWGTMSVRARPPSATAVHELYG